MSYWGLALMAFAGTVAILWEMLRGERMRAERAEERLRVAKEHLFCYNWAYFVKDIAVEREKIDVRLRELEKLVMNEDLLEEKDLLVCKSQALQLRQKG